MTTVDAVVPCYNYARYLEVCVRSILSQRDVDVRVLIIDDASPDNTLEVAKKLAARDRRVSYIRNEVNLGLVGTANRGVIDWASAEYTALISADDALAPGSFGRATQIMNRHPEVGMTYGTAIIIDDRGILEVEDTQHPNYCILSGKDFLLGTCASGNLVSSPTALVRTSNQKLVGGYNPTLPHTCDLEMWMRIATRSSVAVLDATQAFYRWHDQNMSKQYLWRPIGDLREQLATATHVYETCGAPIPEFSECLEAMKLRLAEQACRLARHAIERGDPVGREECVSLARQLNPALWRSAAWRRYWATRLLGRTLVGMARKILQYKLISTDTPFSIISPSLHEKVGWWPESCSNKFVTFMD